jgi:4'-phosphopantetheinyl transferase
MMSDVPAHSSPPFQVTSGELHLWYVAPDDSFDGELLGSYEALLQPDERQRYGALKVERRRREYLVTRALVRCVLSRYYPDAPGDWRFRITAHGKPELDPPRDLHFNLTNCNGLVACAVAGCRVGVDAEPLSRAPAILDLAPRFLAEGEREALSQLDAPKRTDRAISLWTLKEAYVKARGLGLALPLRSFSFAFHAGRVTLAMAPPCDSASWDFPLVDIGSHRVAIAVERLTGEARVVRVFELTPLAGEPREVEGVGWTVARN